MNTDNAYKFLRKHSPILFKWIMEPDMPAGIDEAIAEVMTAFAREACNGYIDYWNSYTGENHLSFDEWMDDSLPVEKTVEKTVVNVEKLFNELGEFTVRVFPDAGPKEHLKKLIIEAGEAIESNSIDEYADCLLAIFGAAYKSGYSLKQLIEAGNEKLKVNLTRKWKKLNNGTYQHLNNQ